MKKMTFICLLLCTQILYAKNIPFTIYHTNDLHSHFDGVKITDEKKESLIIEPIFLNWWASVLIRI